MSSIKDVRSSANSITLSDGKKYPLRFTLNALAKLEEKYGSVEAALMQVQESKIMPLRYTLWAGMATGENKNITEEEVGDLIDSNNLKDIMTELNAAMVNDTEVTQETRTLIDANAIEEPIKTSSKDPK